MNCVNFCIGIGETASEGKTRNGHKRVHFNYKTLRFGVCVTWKLNNYGRVQIPQQKMREFKKQKKKGLRRALECRNSTQHNANP